MCLSIFKWVNVKKKHSNTISYFQAVIKDIYWISLPALFTEMPRVQQCSCKCLADWNSESTTIFRLCLFLSCRKKKKKVLSSWFYFCSNLPSYWNNKRWEEKPKILQENINKCSDNLKRSYCGVVFFKFIYLFSAQALHECRATVFRLTCWRTIQKHASQKSPGSLVWLTIGELMTILACKVPRKPRKTVTGKNKKEVKLL